MRSTTLAGMVFGVLLLSGIGILVASEADELRERARAVQKEAAALAERGEKEQAIRLQKESEELLKAARQLEVKAKGHSDKPERPDIDKAARSLHERLEDLHAQHRKLTETKASEKELAEVREQIERAEAELRKVQKLRSGQAEHHPTNPQAEQLEAATKRIHHLRVAAENLKQADAHELAQKILEQAQSMEREVQAAKARLAMEAQRAKSSEHNHDALQELRAEVERLRAEIKELRQQNEKR